MDSVSGMKTLASVSACDDVEASTLFDGYVGEHDAFVLSVNVFSRESFFNVILQSERDFFRLQFLFSR